MQLKNKFRFVIVLIGLLSLAEVCRAQELSEKPVTELYKRAGLHRKEVKPVRQQPASQVNNSQNLPSSQRIITPPKVKPGTNVNSTSQASVEQNKRSLPSNKAPINPKYQQRRIVKPAVPPEGS